MERCSTTQASANRLLYPRRDAAHQLGISVRSLDYLVSDHQLDTRRIGKRILIPHSELVRFAKGNHPEPVQGSDAPDYSKEESPTL